MSSDRPTEGQDPRPPASPEPPAGAQPPSSGSAPPPPPPSGSGSQPPAYWSAPAPPPSPGGGYPGGPGGPPTAQGAGGFSVGDAFNYGWAKFQANVGTILLAALAYIAIIVVVEVIFFLIFGGIMTADAEFNPDTGRTEVSGGGLFASLLFAGIFGVVFVALGGIMQAGIARGVLGITYGREISVGTMFKFDNVVTVILAGLLVGLAYGVGLVLCIVPGILVLFFSQFYVWFIVDKQMGVLDSIKASFSLVNKHVGTMIGFFLASLLAYVVGAILCGIGLLVAIPVIYIAQGYAYRKLQGEAVAP